MQQLLTLADKIPWIMAPAIVIAATAAISVLLAVIRLLGPASKVMLVAIMMALSAAAIVMRGFWRHFDKSIFSKLQIPLIVSVQNLTSKNYRYCKHIQSGTHSVFLGYYLHICNHILCSFPRQLFFGKLYIRYAQPTLWLNCVNRLYIHNC